MAELSIFILAGGPSQNDVHMAIGRSIPSLPLASGVSVLEGWCRSLHRSMNGIGSVDLGPVRMISSDDSDLPSSVMGEGSIADLCCVRESRRHRGTAGVVADQLMVEPGGADGLVLVIEASASPVVNLGPMLARASHTTSGSHICVLGASELGRYSGVCVCDRESFSLVPDVGFFDLKEQLLPLLRIRGQVIESVTISPRALRLRSRVGWLKIVEAWATRSVDDCEAGAVDCTSRIPFVHREDGVCVIEPGAVIREAVISSSIIMAGAVVESGAVVARSVIGPDAVIAAGSVVVDAVVPARARVESNTKRMSSLSRLQLSGEMATMGGG